MHTHVCVSLLECVYVFVGGKENKRRPREAVNSHERAASAAVAEVTGTIGASSKHEATWWSQCCPTGAKYRFGVVPSTLPLSHVGVKAVRGAWTGGGLELGWWFYCAEQCCAVLSSVCVCCSLLCRLSFVVWFVLLFCSSSSSVVSRPFCLCYFLASMMLFSLLLFFLLLLLLLAHFKHTQTEAHAHTHTQAWQGGVFCFVVLSLTDNAIFRCTFSPRRTLGLVRCECFNLIQ